uniref:Conserved plasma membrane protein n=1 Tax=Syphacia muris TaxID=451379 RepID=A0A0N5AC51_9BILA
LLYSLLTGLAGWGLSDTVNNGDVSHYNNDRKIKFEGGHATVVIEDSTSYHCSFGLYTEELKFSYTWRKFTLIIDLGLYVALIIATTYFEWLFLPWIFLMAFDIIRGIVSVIFIFIVAHWNLARIATGIFFLGLQFFHVSILMIIIAKFQRIHNRNMGNVIDEKEYDVRTRGYPTLPSNYAYSPTLRGEMNYAESRDPRLYDAGTIYRTQPPVMQPHYYR